jgi:hypothetical protein
VSRPLLRRRLRLRRRRRAATTASTGATTASTGASTTSIASSTASDRPTAAPPLAITASITARPGPVTVEHCTGSNDQDWLPGAAFALTNAGDKLCLTAPGSNAQPGTTLTVQPCAGRRGQRWFRP